MIRINNINAPLDFDEEWLKNYVIKLLKISENMLCEVKLHKRSVDARKKNDVHFLCSVNVLLNSGKDEQKIIDNSKCKQAAVVFDKPYVYKSCKTSKKVVIVGAGPAGLFAAWVLVNSGVKPIIIERGSKVEKRIKDIERFHEKGELNENSNVQFGEGGAGTFSDGKLNTGIKDKRIRTVLEIFNNNGAPNEILWQAKPHVGTDILRKVIVNMRENIIKMGGEFRFDEKVVSLNVSHSKLCSVSVENGDGQYDLDCDDVILAIGHSARDTFYSLNDSGINMIAKPFAVGVRIEHKQSEINLAQYGSFASSPYLKPADYKLAVHLENGRGVYTFCMCPGGYVVSAGSEKGMIATNGMSNFARNGENANSAVLVGVNTSDFDSDDVLAGVEFQRKIERKAFEIAGGNYSAPAQTLGSFLYGHNNKIGNVNPTYRPKVSMCNMNDIFPRFITDSLKSGIMLMDKKISGFVNENAIITAPETRSSSPVRILRNDDFQSDVIGLYPCGEGAGYAGGITSAAIDGMKCAESIIDKYSV